MITPYYLIGAKDSTLLEYTMLFQDNWVKKEPRGPEQLFLLQPTTQEAVASIGYLLDADSANKCYTYYYQDIPLVDSPMGL